MSSRLKDELENLCCNNGWSYGVFWRVNRRNSLLLTLEDAYYGEHLGMVIDKILPQVHLLGEGIVGQAAFTGTHRWLFLDACCGEGSPSGYIASQDLFQDNSEFHHLLSSGIKTVAIISVAPLGVVQFGSTQKILERPEFVDQTKSFFRQIESIDRLILPWNALNNMKSEVYNPCRSFASVVLSGNSYSNCGNIKTSYHDSCKELMGKSDSSLVLPQSSAFTAALQHGSLSTVIGDQFHHKNQPQMEGMEAEMTLSKPSTQFSEGLSHFYTSCTENTVLKLQTTNCEVSTLNSFEPNLLCGTGMCVTPKVPSSNLSTPGSYKNLHVGFQGESTFPPSCSTGRLLDLVFNQGSPEGNNTSRCDAGELVDIHTLTHFSHPTEDELPKIASCSSTVTGGSKSSKAAAAVSEPIRVKNLSQSIIQPCLEHGNNGVTQNANLSNTTVVPGSHLHQGVTHATSGINSPDAVCDGKVRASNACAQLPAQNELFDGLGLNFSSSQRQECWDDGILPLGNSDCPSFTGISECISGLDVGSRTVPQRGFFSGEQLLNDVVSNFNSVTHPISEDSASTITRTRSISGYCNQFQLAGLSFLGGNMDVVVPESNSLERINNVVYQKETAAKSHVGSWIDDTYSMNAESSAVTQPKRSEEPNTVAKKRARPGESTRPRPKDRQQIQDRIKELREIVPNGAKCSIDALLDRTIKHMLFLQSVTKYADQLKKDEPKMIGDESCVILKDNTSADGCGATWAFEVGGQTMVCPIIVEDLGPPRQMLIEMLCEDKGFSLEIADIIRGFGLTILKGEIEVQEDKFWARFVVEASKEVTRMDIFLSLVHLLQQTASSGVGSGNQQSKVVDSGVTLFNNFQQSPMPLPVRLVDGIQ